MLTWVRVLALIAGLSLTVTACGGCQGRVGNAYSAGSCRVLDVEI